MRQVRLNHLSLFSLLALMFVALSNDVQAMGDQQRPKPCPVCEAFKAQVTVKWCTTSIDTTTTPFRTPEWKPQDLLASKNLILKLENLVWYDDQSFRSERDNSKVLETYIQQKIDHDQGHLWAAEVDIDNDGVIDKVMKYADGQCPATTAWGTGIFVPDATSGNIDVSRTKPIISQGYLGVTSEVVVYQGETFVLVWNPTRLDAVTILRFKKGRMEQLQ